MKKPTTDATARERAEKPIIFSGPMVKAILEGRKTQTRRVMRAQPIVALHMGRVEQFCSTGYPQDSRGYTRQQLAQFCPYGKVGDRLWVRETFMNTRPSKKQASHLIYRASFGDGKTIDAWSSPIHMPRWASRITLEIVNVRVERLQEISGQDCVAEGIMLRRWAQEDRGEGQPFFDKGIKADGLELKLTFHNGWDALNAKRGYDWASSPWVWVIEFKLITAEIASGKPDSESEGKYET